MNLHQVKHNLIILQLKKKVTSEISNNEIFLSIMPENGVK